tara:strand:+ start:1562 stop:2125 length:564 start_codon:yes stop_codon:yes gene_type:complete
MTAAQAAVLLEPLPPDGKLQARLQLLAKGQHPLVWHAEQRGFILGMALRAALREGVPGKAVAEMLKKSGAVQGPVTIETLLAVPIEVRSLRWLGWWGAFLPRILISASRDALPRTVAGRTYTDADLEYPVIMMVTAEAEELDQWLQLAQWALEHLYPEWFRRQGRDHTCLQRVIELGQMVRAEDWKL